MPVTIQDGIISIILLSFGFFSVIIGFAQCSIRQKETINYLSALSHFSFGLFLIMDTAYLSLGITCSGVFLFFSQTFLVICLISIHLYFKSLFFRKAVSFSLAVKVGALTGLLIFFFIFQLIRNGAISGPLPPDSTAATFPGEKISRMICFIWGFLCFAKASWDFRFLLRDDPGKTITRNRAIYTFILLSALFLLLIAVIYFLEYPVFGSFYRFTLLYYSIFITCMVFFSYRYPDFFYITRTETSRIRYNISKTRGIDTDAVKERLFDLMETEHLFLDDLLTLAKLSSILDLTPHQLSEILNKELKLNFNLFINGYRIEYARKMLTSHPERTILNIALNSGFNSKTTFNKIFSKTTGKTPSEYRETPHRENGSQL